MPLSDKLTFETIVHYNPPLPDCHLVHHWGEEEMRQLVLRVLRFDIKVVFMGNITRIYSSEATEFTDAIRQWIIDLEWDVHFVSAEHMVATAPPFLKTFVDKYS